MSNPIPLLSVVIVIVGDTVESRCDTFDLAGCLDALIRQINPPSMEIIVPYHSRVEGIDKLKLRFPSVTFLFAEPLRTLRAGGGSREHHDELRACGMEAARGEIIAFLEDHVRPDANWAAHIVKAHSQLPCAAIGGAIENGIDRALNWAAYFCDLGKYQNPVSAGESLFASTVNASYKRAALDAIKSIWQEAFNETVVNSALVARDQNLALSPEIVVYQNRSRLRFGIALREFFIWGCSYATIRSRLVSNRQRITFALLSPLLPAVLLFRMTGRVMKKKRTVSAFVKAFPLTAIMTISWSWGEFAGYLASLAANSTTRKQDSFTSNPIEPRSVNQ